MKVIAKSVDGICMERVAPRDRDPKRQLRIFQDGNNELVTVTVHPNVYEKAEKMKPISIPMCTVDMYVLNNDDGSKTHGTYCKQIF